MVYFTSDLHFGHENLCQRLRGMSAEESAQLIINNWNKVITKHDTVYVLGDLTMERHNIIEKYVSQLKGQIIIIGGNHDDKRCCKKYQELGIIMMGCIKYKGFICSHIPLHPKEVEEYRGNIHGHIHKIYHNNISHINEMGNRYYNVCCELHDYTPIKFEEIVKYFESL